MAGSRLVGANSGSFLPDVSLLLQLTFCPSARKQDTPGHHTAEESTDGNDYRLTATRHLFMSEALHPVDKMKLISLCNFAILQLAM